MSALRYLFVYHGGGLIPFLSSSYWIARYGFSVGGFSHVAPILSDAWVIDAYSEVETYKGIAYPSGVQKRPIALYLGSPRFAVVAVPCSHEQVAAGHAYLEHHVGDQYDKLAIEADVFGRSMHRRHAAICSALGRGEAVAARLLQHGPVPNHQVSPNGLFLALTSLAGARIERSRGLDWGKQAQRAA